MKKLFSMMMLVLVFVFALTGGGSHVFAVEEEVVICESFDINNGFSPVFTYTEGWGAFYYLGNFYETLVNYEQGEIKPGLATSWEIDGNEITFKLRKGVKFTDGTDFKAEVVKKNLEMISVITGKQYSGSFKVLTKLEDIQVIDDYQVKLILSEPYYGALQELTMVRPMGMMSLNAYCEDGLSDEIYSKTFGTGKYLIENAVKGENYTFVRNEKYWGEKPELKQFTIKKIPDMESRIMALRTGEIDMIFGSNNISYDSFAEFKDNSHFEAKASKEEVFTRYFLLNTTQKPFDDRNIRYAIQYAVDKDVIINSLFYGLEEKADYLFNPDLPYCDVTLNKYNYNPQKAEQLLEEAGWKKVVGSDIREKNGQKLSAELIYETTGIEEELALIIAGQLKEVGFDIQLSGMELMACMSKTFSGNFNIYSARTYGVPYEPYTEINVMCSVGYHNPAQQGLLQKKEIDLKINNLLSMVDKDKIQESYKYLLTTLHDEALYLPISYKKDLVIFNKNKIKDYEFNGQPLNFDASGIKLK